MEQNLDQELIKLRRRVDRERTARMDAEAIAERGLRELYEKQQQLELLEAIAVTANQATSVRDVLQFGITRICSFTGWPLGHAYLLKVTADHKRLHSTSIWHGANQEAEQAFYRDTQDRQFEVGVGLPGRVMASGSPAWIVDVASDPNFPRAQSAHLAGIQSAFAFPVLVGTEVAAVLEFFSRTTLQPDPSLLRLMSQIGTQLGRVIERQNADEKLIHDASHDPLTGLPNRALFRDRLTRAIARRQRRSDASFAVLFIDLDRFKVVNDSLGHLAGDRLIVEVAARFSASLRQTDMVARVSAVPGSQTAATTAEDYDTLARLGGDEFTILLDDIYDVGGAVRVADRIQEALARPFVLQGQEVYIGASIGIAWSASGYGSADEVLRDADLAMYRAKAMGKGRYEIFDRTMHAAAMNRLALETNLRHALKNSEFVVHYQPIVGLRGGEITGFEALVRWQISATELIYPGDFIDVAEDTGLILFLGLWVLREACRTMRRWHEEFPRAQPLTISVNLSARQFAQPDLVQQVRQIILETGINPATLRLELTESVTIGNAEHAIEILTQIKELGVRISIDDFGTGYSSLSYLHRFPIDILKIDRSFVTQMDNANDGLQIVRTIMSLARNLHMDVVAEGIESEANAAHLQSLGCKFGQGYLFSKPVDAVAIEHLLQKETSLPNWSIMESISALAPPLSSE